MAIRQLDNLVAAGQLKPEPPSASEIDGLTRSGEARLRDAGREELSLESRFDLAYNAAHALALAALRRHGYRSENRYIVFQVLVHTLALPAEQWRVVENAHRKRNFMEYEGVAEVDQELIEALLRVTREIARRLRELGPR